jgi:MYXO-CTERM domain-containing protein
VRTTLPVGIAALGFLTLAPGCAGDDHDDSAPYQTITQPIFGGQNATACQWPTTVLLSGCTGTLVHPQIVTTAAHCGTNHKTALFGESRAMPARRVAIEYCRVVTNHRNTEDDRAFCKLVTPVTDVPIAPILMGCEVDILKAGQKVVVAGFGDNSDDGSGFGTKRWVETTLRAAPDGNGVRVGGNGKAPCFGDSGGPAFVQLADGSWRAFGVDSVGLGDSCGAGDRMSLLHKAAPWIEQQSGIDITPCHDADGTWNPGPNCKGFSLAPTAPDRAWVNGCAEPTLSPPLTACGAGIVGGNDGGVPINDGAVPISDAGASDRPVSVDGSADSARDSGSPPMAGDAGLDLPSMPDGAMRPDGPRAGETVPRPSWDAQTESGVPPAQPPHVGDGGCGCGLGGEDTGKSPGYALAGLLMLAGALRRRRPRAC